LTCSADGDFSAIPPEPALCLYRVAQEALRNVTAHAGASRADVRLIRRDDITEMTVADDGKGFVVGFPQRGKGLGLVSITERVRLAGGTVSIVTEMNKGTRVSVRIPISSRLSVEAGSR
jgi:signal transduction histidine kinase